MSKIEEQSERFSDFDNTANFESNSPTKLKLKTSGNPVLLKS